MAGNVLVAGQIDVRQGLFDGRILHLGVQGAAPAQVFARAQNLVDGVAVAYVKQRGQEEFAVLVHRLALPEQCAFVAVVESADDAQQGRLAAAITALDLQQVAGADGEIQIAEQQALVPLAVQTFCPQQGAPAVKRDGTRARRGLRAGGWRVRVHGRHVEGPRLQGAGIIPKKPR